MTEAKFGKNEFFITKIIQRAFLEVDEAGTRAAAATRWVISEGSCSRPPQRLRYVCNRPFAFTIVHKTSDEIGFGRHSSYSQLRSNAYKVLLPPVEVPVFSGKIVDPSGI